MYYLRKCPLHDHPAPYELLKVHLHITSTNDEQEKQDVKHFAALATKIHFNERSICENNLHVRPPT